LKKNSKRPEVVILQTVFAETIDLAQKAGIAAAGAGESKLKAEGRARSSSSTQRRSKRSRK
jgi:hypothetical protein